MKPLIINGIKTIYMISEKGEIINKKTNKALQGTIRNGYRMVKLTINKDKKDYLVHRLVAETYLPNKNNLPQVNHKDKDRLNNRIDNLEWVSISDNMKHRSEKLQANKNQWNKQDINLSTGWKQYLNTNYWMNEKSQCYNIKTKTLLTPSNKNGKYLKYNLSIEGKPISVLIHKMLYITYYGEYDPTYQINHIDGNTHNNNIANLELITRSENVKHSYYYLHNNINKIAQYNLSGELINTYPSISEASRQTGYNCGAISKVCNGKAKTHKGYIWKKIV